MKIGIVSSILLLSATLTGCASNSDQKHLELLASNRASVVSSELPLEVGPLSIMRANAKGTSIEIMMIYNQDQAGAKPIEQVMQQGVKYYCTNNETKLNLEAGLSYRIKMRNTRGQLMYDEFISQETCKNQ